MTVLASVRRPVAIAVPAIVLCVLSAGCGSTLSGSAVAASTISSPATGGHRTVLSTHVAVASVSVGTVGNRIRHVGRVVPVDGHLAVNKR